MSSLLSMIMRVSSLSVAAGTLRPAAACWRRKSDAMNALTMDSVLFVPDAELAEPVSVPVLRSMKAQPKKLALPGPLIAAGWAGGRSVGAGGAGCGPPRAAAAGGEARTAGKAATAPGGAPTRGREARAP